MGKRDDCTCLIGCTLLMTLPTNQKKLKKHVPLQFKKGKNRNLLLNITFEKL